MVLVDSEDDDEEGNGEEEPMGSSAKREPMVLVNGNGVQAADLGCPVEGEPRRPSLGWEPPALPGSGSGEGGIALVWLLGLSSQNPSMAGVGRDLCGSPSPTACPSRVTQSRLHSTVSRRVWNISREGDSTASLGSLGLGSVTLRGKKFFLVFRRS